jgi:tetratricopeptide (TPR) repeat protein
VSGVRAIVVALVVCVPAPRVLSAQCPDGSPPPCLRRGVALDTSRYLILPFAHREGSQATALDGAGCAELLAEGFARWADIRLADKTRIYDALARRGARVPFRIPFDTGLAIARALGAGRLVMGQLWSFGDTLRLTAGLYDAARGGAPLREVTARVPANEGGMGATFNALADSLLGADAGAARGAGAGAGAEQTRSLRALRAFAQGERAMRSWDLTTATREFRAAVAADSEFAHAYLGLGQAILWAADSTSGAARDRAVIARRAGTLREKLGTTDGARLLAQQAMFERRWPDACARYREMLALDSTNVAAWYGLAECNAVDQVVIRYPRDTTRFTFRGSYETAVQAYRRALLLAPAFNLTFERLAVDRLPHLLMAERWYWREGFVDGSAWEAFPELEADTLAFYPVPGAIAAQGYSEPKEHLAAVARNRRILMEVAASFADALPDEPAAHRTRARALEVVGKLVPEAGETQSAVGELAQAQRLERRPELRVRDAANRVRILLKVGDFGEARRLGDSVLRVAPRPADGIAGVAVLLGRPTLARRFLTTADTAWLSGSADNQPVIIPLEVAQTGLALLVYAAVGAPLDSIVAYERRTEDQLARVPLARRSTARSALLDRPAELVFDALGLRPAHRVERPGPRQQMLLQWHLAHGDTARVRATLDSLSRAEGGRLATGESTPDGVYVDARLLLAVGDSATAARTLDAPLDSLVALHSATLQFFPLAGCLIRMMALRAELAAAQGDSRTARSWASAVLALWSGAEPALHQTVTRMSGIMNATR